MDCKDEPKIKQEEIIDARVDKWEKMYRRAESMHNQRTANFRFFSEVAHMANLYDKDEVVWSEGSTPAIERKIRAQTIQRVPDGEVLTQWDKNSIEQAEIDFIFKNKILTSEFSGRDMLKNIWKTFDNAYVYGFGCVRTGFEKDVSGGIRISYKQIQYNNLYPAPDCDAIEEATWYIHEEMISKSELKNLFDENGNLKDNTWEEKSIKYILQNHLSDGQKTNGYDNLSDAKKGVGKTESVKVRTLYKRGASEFISWSPTNRCIIRTVKNYDPRKEVPLTFMILEPNPEFPYGFSSILPTLSQQQFADMFQSTAYNTLLLAMNPPLIATGDITQEDIFMEPGSWWSLGNNPNSKIEKFPIETTTTTQYGSIIEQISSSMMRNMNITDQTIASEAHVPGWSKTAQGVEAQQLDKTITVNQYQKRVETFFSEWANHALRSYFEAMKGTKLITVDEETRRKIQSIEDSMSEELEANGSMGQLESIIVENQINIDFDKLSTDRLEFKVRTGSLIQSRQQEQRQNIQELLVPVSQTIGALSDQNKMAVEQNMLQMIERLFELSDIDFAKQAGKRLNDRMIIDSLKAAYYQIMDQNKAIEQLQQLAVGKLPPEQQPQQEQQPMPQQPQVQQPNSAQMSPELMQQLMAQQQQAPAEMPSESETASG